MEITKLRKQIDVIDKDIVINLKKRMELAVMTKKFKDAIDDPKRDAEVLSNVKTKNNIPDFNLALTKIYQSIIQESKNLQSKNLELIGFQGEYGAYSEGAGKMYNDGALMIALTDFTDIFNYLEAGLIDKGIVPLENSVEGAIDAVTQLLISRNMHIIGEIIIPIHHSLLAVKDVDLHDIKEVYSHPQALGQCHGFIERNKLLPRKYYDTAGSALMVSKSGLNNMAAIASSDCANIYGLEIIKENIEDISTNATRFVVISKNLNSEGNKVSVVFSAEHKAGSLFNILKLFFEADINLTRIESIPFYKERGKYMFLLDFGGDFKDQKVKSILEKLKKSTTDFKILGTYNKFKLH